MVDVSVIIPIYNEKDFVEPLIQSLQQQIYKNVEFLIVDDGSNDGTTTLLKDISKSLNEDLRFKFLFKVNGGVSSARNYAIKHVTGEYIMFIDSDDKMLPTMILKYVNVIKQNKTDFAFFAIEKQNLLGESMGKIGYDEYQCGSIYNKNELVGFIGQQKVHGYLFCLISKSIFWNQESFDENLKLQEDIDAIAKIISKNDEISAVFSNETYYVYVQHENSVMNSLKIDQFPIFVDVAEQISNYFNNQKLPLTTIRQLNGLKVSALMNVLAIAILSNNKKLEKKYHNQFLTEFKKTDFPDKNVRLRKKIQYFAVKFNIKIVIILAYRKIFKV